ncbi:hypothetical protein AGR7B_pAt0314 [Agrobacterium deltaense RV3]|nr:hypothetical protein AGR7B_pAt0314 [Agrobacterium deltaense RV3]
MSSTISFSPPPLQLLCVSSTKLKTNRYLIEYERVIT